MNLEKYIDHTILKPTATKEDIINLCKEAKKYNFASVCINPYYVKLAKELLYNTDVKVCTVIGFPLGANTIETKLFEASTSVTNGADEIDMVINISELINMNKEYCIQEINTIKEAIGDKTLKVIVETSYLNEDQKKLAANIILESNADFIKTSTGFSSDGAKIDDIKLWKSILNDHKQIKASGGIKTKEQFQDFIKAGADRIGTSNGVALIK